MIRAFFVTIAVVLTLTSSLLAPAQAKPSIEAQDRVFITNEDSNTLTVIDPRSNTVLAPLATLWE